MITGRSRAPLNSSRTIRSVRRRDDNSRGTVQNVRGDSSAVSERHPFAILTRAVTYADWGKRTEARALHDELMRRADSHWTSLAVRASSAATAGLTDDVVPLITRAIEERDPCLMFAMGTWPLTEWQRRVLRDAGKLDQVRRQIGMPSND